MKGRRSLTDACREKTIGDTMDSEILPVLPKNWKWIELEELSKDPKQDIVDGPFGSDLRSSEYVEEGIPIIRLQNIGRNTFIWKNIKFITYEKARELERHNFIGGDIVITKLGNPLGEACEVPLPLEKGVIVADIVRARLPWNDVNKKFLIYGINSPLVSTQFSIATKGTTRPRVNLNYIRKIKIPFAPLPEQQRIVAKIEELFTQLDAAEAALKRAKANLKRYRQSVLQAAVTGELTREWREAHAGQLEPAAVLLERIRAERKAKWAAELRARGKDPLKEKYIEPQGPDVSALPGLPEGWVWTTIEQVGHTTGGLTKNQKRNHYLKRMPYLTVVNVYANDLQIDNLGEMGILENEVEKAILEKGDLLIVEGNGSKDQIGRAALWSGIINPCVHQNHIIKVRFDDPRLGPFALYWLLSSGGREAIERVASSTSGLYTLSISKVSSLPIPLTTITEQEQIIMEIEEKMTTYQQEVKNLEKAIAKINSLRQSILQRAFSGQLLPDMNK